MRRVVKVIVVALRLGLALPIALPVLLISWASALVVRRRYARVEVARAALAHLHVAGTVASVRLAGGGRSSAVAFVTLEDGRRLVLKKALPYGSLMALASRVCGPMPYLGCTPAERVQREADALDLLAREGVAVPRLVAADAGAGLVLMECVDGECLAGRADEDAVAARFGHTLAAVHRAGVALCDGHPGNAILAPGGRVIMIDLEWAATGTEAHARRGFDLAYAAAFLPDDAARDAFFRGYGRVSQVLQAQLEAANDELAPFAPLLRTDRLGA